MAESVLVRSRGSADPGVRASSPAVRVWAVVGLIIFAVELWTLGSWILSGRATPTPDGASHVPTATLVLIRVAEIGGVVACALFLWFFLWRPWRRAGHLTSDGLFCLVFATMWWLDPISNYAVPVYGYNTHFVNLGSWVADVPGSVLPNADRIAMPILWLGPVYIYLVFGMAVAGNPVLRRVQRRFPTLSKGGLFLVAWAFFGIFDLAIECFAMRLGLYSWGGVVEELTLFYGHYYQVPIYNSVLFGFVWASYSCLRLFRDDRGLTFVERGVDSVAVAPVAKAGLRFFAVLGFCNLVFFVAYIVPMQVFALNSDPWPEDITNRSYFVNELCGPGTTHECASPFNSSTSH